MAPTTDPLSHLADAARTASAATAPSTVAIGRHGRGTGVVIDDDVAVENSTWTAGRRGVGERAGVLEGVAEPIRIHIRGGDNDWHFHVQLLRF